MTPADALTAAFRFVDDEAGRINGVLNEPSGPAMDDVAMDLCKAFGLPLDQHWPEALTARLSADAAREAIPIGSVDVYEMGWRDGLDEAEKLARKIKRRHRRYVSNGKRNGLSAEAVHSDVMAAHAADEVGDAIAAVLAARAALAKYPSR